MLERKTMTAQETANYLGVHLETIYTMVRQKEIPHIRIRRRILFNQDTIDSWMRQQEEKSLQEVM